MIQSVLQHLPANHPWKEQIHYLDCVESTNTLAKEMAKAGAPHNVRCVCVSPGPMMTRPAMANMKTLMGRAAEPQEIIDLVLFLASDKGQFINGTNILIDGGRNAMNRG